MKTFDCAEKLIDDLAAVSATETVLIGVDGKDGAGKTTLAGKIAGRLGGKVLSLDSYLAENRESYVPNLHVCRLRRDVTNASGRVVLEGACLLAVANKIGITIQKLVYVKRVNQFGLWLDADVCEPKVSAEDVIKQQEELAEEYARVEMLTQDGTSTAKTKKGKLPELVKELICYHKEYQPQARADYVFLRYVA
jgi:hypothetical protein